MDKEDVRYIYIYNILCMQYYSSIEKHEIIPFSATWMDPAIIVLREVKDIYHITYL